MTEELVVFAGGGAVLTVLVVLLIAAPFRDGPQAWDRVGRGAGLFFIGVQLSMFGGGLLGLLGLVLWIAGVMQLVKARRLSGRAGRPQRAP